MIGKLTTGSMETILSKEMLFMESQRLPRIGHQAYWIATVIGSAPGILSPSFRSQRKLISGTSKPVFYKRNKDQVVNARLHAAGETRSQPPCLILQLTEPILGDGKTDDTVALQSLFQYAAENNLLLYIPGNY